VRLFLDIETYSDVPLDNGTYAYAEAAEVLLASVAADDGDVRVLDFTDGDTLDDLRRYITDAERVVIHNSAFDRVVLRSVGIDVPTAQIDDTMVRALAHSLPGSLGKLCDVLGVPQDQAKDKRGQRLIHLFSKPRPKNVKLRRATRETHPAEWAEFIDYARLDVEAMREIDRRLPSWNNERELWLLDQTINDLAWRSM